MNKRKIILFTSIILMLLCFTIGVIIIANGKDKKIGVYLTTIPKSYCYVSDTNTDKEIEILVYLNNKYSFITRFDKLEHSYIRSRDRMDELLVYCTGINDTGYKTIINEENYYLYSFSFNIPISSSDEYDLCIEDAIVEMSYPEDNVIIGIGSFYYYKVPNYGDKYENLSISKVKGIVNTVNGNKSIVGVELGFRNLSSEKITIKEIKMLDKTIEANTNEMIKCDFNYSNSDSISNLLGYNYDIYGDINNKNCNIEINSNNIVNYIIPIKYNHDFIVNSVSFVIVYELNNKEYKYYSDTITLFNNMNLVLEDDSLDIICYEENE